MIVRPMAPERYGWIAERAHLVIGSEFRAIEAVDGDRTLGAIGFDGWTPNAVCMHVALDSPIALRGLVKQGFGIAFVQCQRRVALCTVLGTNTRSLRLVAHLGFREIARVKDGWESGVDLVFFEMRREECRFLERNEPRSVGDNTQREAA